MVLVRSSGRFIASQIIKQHLKKTTSIEDEEELELLTEFHKEQLLRPESSEVIMGTIFHVGNWAYMPLMDIIDSGRLKETPLLILYGGGDVDWMWRNNMLCEDTINYGEAISESSYLEHIFENGNSMLTRDEMLHQRSRLIQIENGGHQLMVNNHIDTNYAILKFTHDDSLADEYKT